MLRRVATRFSALTAIFRFISILVSVFAAHSVMSQTPPVFLPVVTYDSGGFAPTSVTTSDVNGDGRLDLIVTNGCSEATCIGPPPNGTVAVLLGNGDGTFKSAVSYSPGGVASDLASVAVADVNGDGKPDLLVAIVSANFGEGGAGVFLGNGDGTFRPMVAYDSGGMAADSIAVADVNGDGQLDLLMANADSSTAGVLLGNGDGTFQSPLVYDAGGYLPRSIAVGDVNSDGKLDLVLASTCGNLVPCTGNFDGRISILLGNGDGTFNPPMIFDSGGYQSASVAVADVNDDGRLDLVALNVCINSLGVVNCGTVDVLLGNGDGTFQPAVSYSNGGGGVGSVAISDVNGDGKPDLVTVSCCGSVVGVLLGNGDGTFQPVITYNPGGAEPEALAIADVNDDGKPDVLVTNTPSNNVGVLINNTPFDTSPPVIAISATPKILWPPTGRIVPITVSGTITDAGSGVNATTATYAVKDEYGEIQPTGAISLGPEGRYSFVVLLRPSRRGSDLNGRHYKIMVRAKDNAGNVGSNTAVVTVPHRHPT